MLQLMWHASQNIDPPGCSPQSKYYIKECYVALMYSVDQLLSSLPLLYTIVIGEGACSLAFPSVSICHDTFSTDKSSVPTSHTPSSSAEGSPHSSGSSKVKPAFEGNLNHYRSCKQHIASKIKYTNIKSNFTVAHNGTYNLS